MSSVKRRVWFLGLATCLCASWAAAVVDPRENNFRFFVDGVQIDGVVGYRIEFTRTPVTGDDQRRLGIAYSPTQKLLTITVTQKGMNRLLDWINSATDTGAPTTKTVSIQTLDTQSTLLVQWDITGVIPATLNSAAQGTINEVDATIEFLFDRLHLTKANGN
jgi:hypothetical protein